MTVHTGDVESAQLESNQEFKSAGIFGGHAGTVGFFALWEGFTLIWVLLTLSNLVGGGFGEEQRVTTRINRNQEQAERSVGFVIILFPILGYCFHLATQYFVGSIDPGRVHEMLRSLGNAMEDAEFARILVELRKTVPQLTVHAEAYHTTSTSHGDSDLTTDHIDHVENQVFGYGSWKDMSGHISGLEKYQILAVEVNPVIECANNQTRDSLANLHKLLKAKCAAAAPGKATRSYATVDLEHPTHPIHGSKVFVTRSSGAKSAGWMNGSVYNCVRFAFPFLGTIYRIMFFTSMKNVRFTMSKHLSIHEELGPGWLKKCENGDNEELVCT
jgi:hypothetical protein